MKLQTVVLGFLLTTTGPAVFGGTLLRQSFEAADWPACSVATSGGATASTAYGPHGTIDVVTNVAGNGVDVPSKGLLFTVNSSAAAGTWKAGLSSGVLTLTTPNTTISNPGLITLSFSLRASRAHPVVLRLESMNDTGTAATGALRKLIYPAAPNYTQRFAVDLSTMQQDGGNAFVPTATKIRVTFELDSTAGGDGWPAATGLTLKIDNLHYATPAWYVGGSGAADNTTGGRGTTAALPFASINYALTRAVPGDIVVVRTGTYGAVSFRKTVNSVAQCLAGAPDAWITLKNYPGETPVVRNRAWSTVTIGGIGTTSSPYTGPAAAYLEVRGLTLRGYSTLDANGDRDIDPSAANPLLSKLGTGFGETNCNGFYIEGRNMTNVIHDVRFADNVVESVTGGGVAILRADRLLIENNVVRDTCWWMSYGGSGISTVIPADVENNGDYRCVIQGNETYGNETMVPWIPDRKFSDGNGIILDINRNIEVGNGTDPAYRGRTLVQNNLTYNNGGSGIHAFEAQNVDIIHNTAYLNSASPRLLYGQIYAGYTRNVRMIGNILVAPANITGDPSRNESYTTNGSNLSGIVFQDNVYFGLGTHPALPANTSAFTASGNTNADPLFFAPSRQPSFADFRLRSASPARNSAPAIAFRSAVDVDGRPRPLSLANADRGAFQTQSGAVFAPVLSPAPGNYAGTQFITLASDTAGSTFTYTTNGTTPTVNASGTPVNGTLYGGPIPVSAASTLKAVAWKSGLATSEVASGAYTFTNVSTVPIPDLIFYPDGGTYAGSQLIGIICRTPGALVRYTTDGTQPSPTTGTLASNGLVGITARTTLKAIAYLPGRANSAVRTSTYTLSGGVGNASAGTSLETIGANKIRFSRFTATGDNTLANVYARVSGAGTYRVALYADTSGAPSTRLAVSNALTNPAAGWATFTFATPPAVTNGRVYWLAIWSDNAAARIYADTTGGTVRELSSTLGGNGSWPNPAGTTVAASTNPGYAYALYATVLNRAPAITIANASLTVTLPATAGVSAVVTDDAIPKLPGATSVTWSKLSGPGTVSFANAAAAATTASFGAAGAYVLRLTATDGSLATTADVNVAVSSGAGPVTYLGSLAPGSTTLPVPSSAVRFARVQAAGSFTVANIHARTVFAGAGSVYRAALYADASGVPGALLSRSPTRLADAPTGWNKFVLETPSAITNGSFYWLAIWCNTSGGAIYANPAGGTVRELNGNNLGGNGTWPNPAGTTTASATPDFSLSIYAAPAATNLAPLISAGDDEATTLPAPAALGGSVTDDAQPLAPGAPAIAWLKLNGPGTVTFANSADDSTTATFSLPGTYVLRLTATDGELDGPPDDVTVTVNDSYTAWAGRTGVVAATDDFDGDGLVNLLEYALGTLPASAASVALPVGGLDAETGRLTLTFQRIADPTLTYEVLAGDDLEARDLVWSSNGAQNIAGPVTFTDSPIADSPRRFLRLQVTKP